MEQRSFDARTGRASSVTTANGLTSLMTSDGFGRELSILTPEGNLVETSYRNCATGCPAGATQVITKEAKRVGGIRTAPPVLQFTDNANHVMRTLSWGFDGRQIASDTRYDEVGRPQKVYWPRYVTDTEAMDSLYGEPAGATLRSISLYDAWDRPWITQTLDELGTTQSTTHTWLGFKHTTKNPKQQEISETRDVWGKLATAVDANGKTTTYAFDAFGNLARTTDPVGNVVQVTYDDWGRRTQLQDPDLGTVRYSVDPLGQVWKQVSAKQYAANDATVMQYDALGRMVARTAVDSAASWTYDVLSGTDCALAHSCGQLVQSKTLAGGTATDYVQQHSYDVLGRPDTTTTVLDVQYTSRREYDNWGRLINEQHQRDGHAARGYARRYNAWGQLERIERNGQPIWTATALDAAGRITASQLGNGLAVAQAFNPYTGRLTSGTVGSQLGEGYSYDVLGNVNYRIQQWGTVSFSENFEYDGLNRLRLSTISGFPAQEFTYDDIGNLISKTGVGSGNYVYPGAGQQRPHAVKEIPGIGSFHYDVNGNLEDGAGRTITWNSFDMPVTITRGTDSSTFYYGPDHQRVKQVRGNTTVWYAGAMEVETGPQTVVKTYLPNALGVEIDRAGSAQLYYTHRDRLGSVMAISDQAGVLSEMLAYDSWGKRREQATPATPDNLDGQIDNKGFTGHEMLDQLDLVHMNGRIYDPLVARFMSADPIIQEPEHSQSYNRYTYVWNNPTNLTDPTGFQAMDLISKWMNEAICATTVRCPSGGNQGGTGQSSAPAAATNEAQTTPSAQTRKDSNTQTTSANKVAPSGKEELEAAIAQTNQSLADADRIQKVFIRGKWAQLEDWAIKKQNETGNWLYSIPGTLGTVLSSEEYTNRLEQGFTIVGALKGGSPSKNRGKPPAPLDAAEGRAHTIIERPGAQGQYTTYYENGTWKQYRGSGQDHGGIPRPNVKEAGANQTPDGQIFIDKGRVRPPTQDEIPGS